MIVHACMFLTETTITQQPDNKHNNSDNCLNNNDSTCIHVSDRNNTNTTTRKQTL